MAFIDNAELNNIRSSVSIVDVISDYLPLTKKGKNYFGVCPFHDDHSPSMSVSVDKQIYTCFSCGATGNVFKFVMDYEHITFPEAVKLVATKAGIDVDIKGYKAPIKKNKEMYEMYDISNKLYQNNINTKAGAKALEYLKSRDIDEAIIREFGIGLALKNHDLLNKLLTSKGYTREEQLKSGLVIKNDYGYQDIYYDRIMFPLWDMFGQVVGFSGRRFDGLKEYKYINTKETEIFKKGEILYNYHRAKDEARRKNKIIIMEGFMDVIRAYTVGIKNVVATMGTAVTRENANNIKRMAKEVILCFDGDEAGAKATESCINELVSIGVTPKVVRLPDDLDPDDYIKKYGGEAFMRMLDNPINIMDFKLNYLKHNKDLTSSVDMASYVNSVINELNKIADPVLREVTIKKVSEESSLDEQFIKDRLVNDVVVPENIPKKVEVKKYSKYEKAEQNLIYYMLRDPEVIKLYNKKITFMPTKEYRFLAREISYFYKKFNYIDIADLISFLSSDEDTIKVIGEIEALNLKEEHTKEEINDYIKAIFEYNINSETKRLTEQMRKEVDPIKKAELGSRIMDLRIRRDNND